MYKVCMDAGMFDLRWETALRAPGWLENVSEVLAVVSAQTSSLILTCYRWHTPMHCNTELQMAPSRPGF